MFCIHLLIGNVARRVGLLLFFAAFTPVTAQEQESYSWWNPVTHSVPVVEGTACGTEMIKKFTGSAARIETNASNEIWPASQHAGGLNINFKTNGREIIVRYQVKKTSVFSHIPTTGVSGVDLYGVSKDGNWIWCKGNYSHGDTITCRFVINSEDYDKNFHPSGGRFRLYLPIYCKVSWLEVGVHSKSAFHAYPTRKEKPVVIYGVSTAQAACASRAGLSWTAQLERRLDRPLINLACMDNATRNREMISLVAELDPKIVVVNCLHNPSDTTDSEDDLKARIYEFVKKLRSEKPDVPILLTEHTLCSDTILQTSVIEHRYNQLIREVFQILQQEDEKDIFFLNIEEDDRIEENAVEDMQPTDWGMLQYASVHEKKIRSILKEPKGNESTTIPCIQYRDAKTYDWMERHQQILGWNRENIFPAIIFLGNSITHYWGGSHPERGKDSWEKNIAPLNARNGGFGWDRIENVLWRVYHDELDGFTARQVVVWIGSNNMQRNTDAEIISGLNMLLMAIKERQPRADIVLLGIIPRENYETRIVGLNKQIAELALRLHTRYADPGRLLTSNNKKLNKHLFIGDGVHPNAEGYRIIAAELRLHLAR